MTSMRDLDDVERENQLRDQGYMDAAAVPVPDAGDDTLREQLAEALHYQLRPEGVPWPRGEGPATKRMYTLADALLPLIREHVATARRLEREALITQLELMVHAALDGGETP